MNHFIIGEHVTVKNTGTSRDYGLLHGQTGVVTEVFPKVKGNHKYHVAFGTSVPRTNIDVYHKDIHLS